MTLVLTMTARSNACVQYICSRFYIYKEDGLLTSVTLKLNNFAGHRRKMAKAERIPKTNTVRVTSKPRAKLASAISVSHSESDSRGCVFEIPFLIYINKAFL